jgi:hypothetical protein
VVLARWPGSGRAVYTGKILKDAKRGPPTVRTDSGPVPTPDLASANIEGAGGTPGTPTFNAQQVAAAVDFKLAERNEVNLTAAAPAPTPAPSRHA